MTIAARGADVSSFEGGPPLTDSHLIQQSCSDAAQFGHLFSRHGKRIHRYVGSRTGYTNSDDLTAEVFLTAFHKRTHYDVAYANALPWLYGIAGNVVARELRRVARDQSVYNLFLSLQVDDNSGLETRVVESEYARSRCLQLKEALQALSTEELETLLLFAWEDMSYEDIARAINIPVGTVKSRLNRTRRKLNEFSQTPSTER